MLPVQVQETWPAGPQMYTSGVGRLLLRCQLGPEEAAQSGVFRTHLDAKQYCVLQQVMEVVAVCLRGLTN